MLTFISPILIKKLILNIFMTNLSVVMNAQAQDSLAPKKVERIPGKIWKVEKHEINLLNTKSISMYPSNRADSPKNGLLILSDQACETKGTSQISRKSSKFED